MILKQSTAVDVLIGPFLDLTDGATAETGESPSVKLSKNGQTMAAKNDATTPVHDADGYYNCELDATDTNTVGTLVLTVAASANALPVRHEFQVVEEATYDLFYASAATATADIADAVWNENIAAHQTASTFGRQATLGGGVLVDTTITGTPTSTTLQLSAGSTVDDFYNDQMLYITSGTGGGQARPIEDYVGATKTITIDEPFATTPVATDAVVIKSTHVHPLSAINAEVVDALNVDTITLPGQEAPPATPTHREAIAWLYKVLRNKNDQNSTTWQLYDDAGTTVDAKATVSDDGTTATKGEIASGP